MLPGEVARRWGFNALDYIRGGRLNKLKEVNKAEIVHGVTRDYQERRLSTILKYASEHSEFYKGHGTDGKLSDFPVMKKGDFLANYDGIISDEYRDKTDTLSRFTTSGSTGTPFTVYADAGKLSRVQMNFISVMELNGFRLGMKRGEFRAWIKGKNTISLKKSIINNLVMIDISNMGDTEIRKIFERIRSERIQCLVMYSSALEALVSYAERSTYDVSDWNVEMIFTMGEALPEGVRQKTEELWGINPVLSYGNNENGFIAVSLDGSSEYYIDLYNFYIEILKMDSDEPAEEGEPGRIVVTDYYNRAFPMIRYDTGDTGILRTLPDTEGRVCQVFTQIWGRRGSLIRNTKGEPLSIHVFMNNTLNFEGILRQARVIQTDPVHYRLLLNTEMGGRSREPEIVESYRKYLGEDAVIEVEYVDGLPVEQSGKTMVCEQRWEPYLV